MDKQKVKKVYEENVKAVYKYLFCLTHSADLAEELTQEKFRSGCARLPRGSGIRNWKGGSTGRYR